MKALLPYFVNFEIDILAHKNPDHSEAFWVKLAWEVLKCDEAIEVFPDMTRCPVCLAQLVDNHMLHKSDLELFN